MNNITAVEQALIQRQQIPEALAPNMLKPSYDGLGLSNIAALTLEWLCEPYVLNAHKTVTPFNPKLLAIKSLTDAWHSWQQQAPINHVVLIILDAFGYEQFRTLSSEGVIPSLTQACNSPQAFFMPATSVFPSTTVTALTSAATAQAPALHGLINTHIYFQEVGSLVNLIGFRPSFTPTSAPYLDSQLNPDTLLPMPNIYVLMEKSGVDVEIINFHKFQNTSISRFTSAGSNALLNSFFGYRTPADAFSQLRQRLTSKTPNVKSFTYLYIPEIDTFAHCYQPLSQNYRAEVASIDFSLYREVLAPLAGRNDTVLLITADHGQRAVHPDKITWLNHHPILNKNLSAPFTGGTQARYLYIHKGKEKEVYDYVQENLAEEFLLLSKAEAIELGLLGLPGNELSELSYNRLGDAIIIPKGDWVSFENDTQHYPVGIHGGLSHAEMLIPFLAYRC
ncbi:phosphodiesterase [Rivularia sp. IAM M-261]|nr:phosphodiesterase [Calothrix sp. PCC 7716]GJD20155.1 phosphodiesterase [Rivularia sp. IAM M-261]